MGQHGLTCDNTLSFEIVTANGDRLTVSGTQHPDLYRALKGGSGNFGVVISITYRLHPVGMVISGMLRHPRPRAREVLHFFRDFVSAGLPDALIVYTAVITGPGGTPLVASMPSYTGTDLAEGERLLAPLRAFGPPVADMVQPMPYLAMQSMLDAAAPYGGLRSYGKSQFLRDLPAEAIDTFVQHAERCTSPRTMTLLEHTHGALSRVAADATAFPARDHPFDLAIISRWDDAADDGRHVAWTRGLDEAMQPWSAAMVYGNALSEDDSARFGEAYGPNYERLAVVKAKYDPTNRFRRNQNVLPAMLVKELTLPRHETQPAKPGAALA
jgi:FAD/FMN-containing dehydrogenase